MSSQNQNLLNEVSCPQCGSWERRNVVKEEGRRIVKCKTCRLMFTSPQLTDEARIQALNTDYRPVSYDEQFTAIAEREKKRVAEILKFRKGKTGNWLDIGC